MLIDCRELENNSIIEGDLCIIGAGMAGISIALQWIGKPFKVILLEGGGFEYNDSIQELYNGNSTGLQYFPLKSTRLHYFGGTSGHWGGWCTPLDNIDFKKRDWIKYSGWPISKKDLIPFYEKSTKILDLESSNFDLNNWQQKFTNYESFDLSEDFIWNKIWQFSPPTRFGHKYKQTILDAKNIHLYTYANVTELLPNESITAIKKIRIKNLKGQTHIVKAKSYILATGGIQNPRLLLASNKKNEKGLGNNYDLVGRFFMEHLEMNIAELWLTGKYPLDLYLLNDSGSGKLPRAELAITERAQQELNLLNGTISLSDLVKSKYHKSNIEKWNDDNPIENQKKYSRSLWEKVKLSFSVAKDYKDLGFNSYRLFLRMEQQPNPNSRVFLSLEKDGLGMPKANLNWELSEIDKISLKKIAKLIAVRFGAKNIGRIRLDEFLRENSNTPPIYSAGWHHMGTTKMNDDPKKGVIDSNCRVHGIRNLFIAGSSCFPTAGAANPTLTIVALSLRLSKHLMDLYDADKL